ncbi:MAG: gliding motility-associated C-terminal domain-containing protein [Vicingus serpentipes]|nr:gliding motility-associated C-terminal domain-containing protein [Vicingus serpentipes]
MIKIKTGIKSLFILMSFMMITELLQAQCCGDGVCDSLAGENATNCPYDCAGGGFNCPNTVGTFFKSGFWPVSSAVAQSNGWCYTFTSPYPSIVCFEYEVPNIGDTASVSFTISGCNSSTVNQGNNPPGGGCNSAGGGIRATYDNACNLISNSIRTGGAGCYTPGDIITVCIGLTDTLCGSMTICPVIQTAGPGGTSAGCAPFNISPLGSLADLCDSTSGVGLVTPPCGNHFSYLWDDPLTQTDSMATGLTPGTYTVVVTNDSLANCDTTITVVVPNITPPVFTTDTINICEGESVFLEGANQFTAGTYNDTIFNGDCQNITVTTLTVEAVGTCSPSSILIPNVFTPNGDGSNDVFTVDGVNLRTVEAEIYNRWGQLLYSWNDPAGFWDGRTPSAAEASEGTYFYIIKAVGLDDIKYEKEGSFTLIR